MNRIVGQTQILAFKENPWSGVGIHIRVSTDDSFSYVHDIVLKEAPASMAIAIPPAPLVVDNRAAQALMDSMYDCGIRPSRETRQMDHEGIVKAKDGHIEDLRKVLAAHLHKWEVV